MFGSYLFSKRAVLISSDIRLRTYAHLQSLPLSYFQQRRQGEVLSVLTNDVVCFALTPVVCGALLATRLDPLPFLLDRSRRSTSRRCR